MPWKTLLGISSETSASHKHWQCISVLRLAQVMNIDNVYCKYITVGDIVLTCSPYFRMKNKYETYFDFDISIRLVADEFLGPFQDLFVLVQWTNGPHGKALSERHTFVHEYQNFLKNIAIIHWFIYNNKI